MYIILTIIKGLITYDRLLITQFRAPIRLLITRGPLLVVFTKKVPVCFGRFGSTFFEK